MSFEDQAVILLDHAAERTGLFGLVSDDLAVIELDAGLNDGGNHPRPRRSEAGLRKDLAMGLDRCARCLRCGDCEACELFRSPARLRHLGSDDIDRRLPSGAAIDTFGHSAQPRCARCDDLVVQRRLVVRARHGAVEMDLAEAGADILFDHHVSARHRFVCRQRLPWIRTKVISAKDNLVRRKACPICNASDEIAELRGLHAGIAAVLIDLVRRRLNQRERNLVPGGVNEGCFNHKRMRGTHGKDAARLSGLVPRDAFDHRLHFSSGASASRTAAAHASPSATSLSRPGNVPITINEMTAVISGAPALVSGETTMACP